MWLDLEEDLIVNVDMYIRSQPVRYEQIASTIAQITEPINAYVDLTGLNVWRVNYFGLVRIIWTLHRKTEGLNILKNIYFVGANDNIIRIWNRLKKLMPRFVQECVVFLQA